jgi:hypothetical protein
MPLCSTVSQGMAESGVLSTQKGSKSLPENELGPNRRKEDVRRTWIRVRSVLWDCQHGHGY